MSNKYRDSVAQGVQFIAGQQLPRGGFISVRSSSRHHFSSSATEEYQTVFFPALIGTILEEIDDDGIGEVLDRIVQYLMDQKDADWSFNYWDKDSHHYQEARVPNDLDDTFCALRVLYVHRPEMFDGKTMAQIIDLLCFAEIKVGGPYKTWLISDDNWADIDPVVNSNIGYYLQKCGVELPGVVDYIDHQIAEQDWTSKYYSDVYSVYYFMARYHNSLISGDCIDELQQTLCSSRDPLRLAQSISTLLRIGNEGPHMGKAVAKLIDLQQSNGSWPPVGLYVDAHVTDGTVYAGAGALTTAFCIEAINMYEKSLCTKEIANSDVANYSKKVLDRVKAEVAEIASFELKNDVYKILDSTLGGSKERRIIDLPHVVAQAVKGWTVPPEVIEDLSAMSLWGWATYTIQDDCMDTGTNLDMLPASNFCMRKLTQCLDQITATSAEFRQDVQDILDIQDNANAWELRYCRVPLKQPGVVEVLKLPNYENHQQLANKSLGHTISALGVLYSAGFTKKSDAVIAIRTFMNHYLIARQLNDDAHDWEDDLRSGHVNSVATRILQKYILTKPSVSARIDLNTQAEILQKILWEQEIVPITELILVNIEAARTALRQTSDLSYEVLDQFLLPIEKAANTSLEERRRVLDLISHLY